MRENGGAAFPLVVTHSNDRHEIYRGMTMRQWYKGMAMQGLLAQGLQRHELGETAFAWYVSRASYFADTLIAEDTEQERKHE